MKKSIRIIEIIATIICIILILGTTSFGFGGGQASRPENEISEETETQNINGFIYLYNNAKNKDEYLQNYIRENEINTVEKTENFKNALNAEFKKRESDSTTNISSSEEKKKRVEQAKKAYEAVDNYQKATYGFGGGQTSGVRCRTNDRR